MGYTHHDGISVNNLQVGGVSFDPIASAPSAHIVVSKDGNDTTGVGSFALPYKTLTKAFTVWTALRPLLIVLNGDYEEAATLTWPAINNLKLVGIGDVTISNADAAAQVLLIQPGSAATSSFVASLKDVNIAADTQIGIKIANSTMTKKLSVYLDGVSAEMDTSGDSIDIAGTVSGQAIRVYAKNINLEGLLHFTANDAGSRLRIQNSELVGGITLAGQVAAECTLRNVQMLTDGVTKAAEWAWSAIGCVYATDADPAVYTEFANVYDT